MHLTLPLHCPRCQRTFDRIVRCPDCDVAPVDALGRAAAVSARDPLLSARNAAWAAGLGLVAIGAASSMAFGPVGIAIYAVSATSMTVAAAFALLRPYERRDARDDATTQALRASPVRIADALADPRGPLCVRGQLVVVPGERRIGGIAPRFAVTDGTGVALVDDDSLIVWATDAGGPTVQTFDLPDRARVRVVGHARIASGDEARLVWHGDDVGYRTAPEVLAFDGDADRPTVAFLEP